MPRENTRALGASTSQGPSSSAVPASSRIMFLVDTRSSLQNVSASQEHAPAALSVPSRHTQKVSRKKRSKTSRTETEKAKKSSKNFMHHIQRLRKRTDGVLTERTNLRRRFKDWEDSRDHLFSSVEALVTILHGHATMNSSSRPMRLSSYSDELTRGGEGSESSAENVREVEDTMLECCNQVLTYSHVLKHREVEVKASMDAVSKIEFKLKGLQDTIATAIDAPDFIDSLMLEMEESNDGTGPPSAPPSGRETPPSLVSEYYDRHGDVNVFRDQLREWDVDYLEGQSERAFLRDRGDILEPSDEIFTQNYNQRRDEIFNELQAALRDADDLKRRCEEAGLDIDAYRFRRSSNVYEDDRPDSSEEDEEEAGITSMIPTTISPDEARPDSRVEPWLRNVPTGGPAGRRY